jgi:hypothetical protein
VVSERLDSRCAIIKLASCTLKCCLCKELSVGDSVRYSSAGIASAITARTPTRQLISLLGRLSMDASDGLTSGYVAVFAVVGEVELFPDR